MISMSFDLSSVGIGITFSQVEGQRISYINTLAVIPKKPSAKEFGYTTKQPKVLHYNGNKFKGLLKPGEHFISKTEAAKRVAHYNAISHRYLLTDIGKQCGYLLQKVNPGVIAIEKNKSFNGILTTKLLGEIAGGLYFYAGAHGIPMYDYDEATIRANIRRTVKDFRLSKSGKDEATVAVDTKWEIFCRLRSYFEKNYPNVPGFQNITMDESDSLAVFYHWFTKDYPNM